MAKNREVRYDVIGGLRFMAEAEGYVMVRRRGAAPFILSVKEWNALSREPHPDPSDPAQSRKET